MIKRLLLIPFLLLTGNLLFSQNLVCLDLPEDFKLSYQISSLAIKDEQVYLITEKCKNIFVVDKQTLQISKTIDLSKQKPFENLEVGLEGSAIYGNNLFMIDEKKSTIYAYDIVNDKVNYIQQRSIDLDEYKDDKSNYYGLEGIAINSINKVCYILREKNKNNQSVIYSFKINDSNQNFSLEFIDSILIQHNDNSWRYSDLYYDESNKRLLCLKSRFIDKKNCSNNQYQVDFISVDKSNGNVIKGSKTMLADISKNVCKYNEIYSTNLEGITIYKGDIYIVSDNNQLDPDDCSRLVKKTLFVRLKL